MTGAPARWSHGYLLPDPGKLVSGTTKWYGRKGKIATRCSTLRQTIGILRLEIQFRAFEASVSLNVKSLSRGPK